MLKTMVGGWRNGFVSTWKTDNAGVSTSVQIRIPTVSSGTYNCVVYWGDGSSSTITTYNDAAWTHTYAGAGTYTVNIVGTFVGIQFANGGDKLKILSVLNWGAGFRLGTTQGIYFYGCSNLQFLMKDVLNLSGTTSLNGAFIGCPINNPTIGQWNVSAVTDFNNTFNSCSSLAADLSAWNVSSATVMSGMLAVTRVTSSLNNWNVSNVTNMSSFLAFNTVYNASLSSWNTSKVTTMASMFQNCTAFNQDVSTWDIRALTAATSMFTSSGFNITNYDKLLDNTTGWPSQATIQSNVVFSAGSAHYSAGAPTTGRAILTGTKLWVITDGGTP